MRLKQIKEIEPELSRCISVDSDNKLFAIGESGLLTHNSVLQRNIIIGCILRPEHWILLGIDLKRVEISKYRKFGVKVATDLPTAEQYLAGAQALMMKRYTEMEKYEYSDFTSLDNHGPSLLLMIDEAGELLSPQKGKALHKDTLVLYKENDNRQHKPIKDIEIGDVVYNSEDKETLVINKYFPQNQNTFKVSIESPEGVIEDFMAGEEHLWEVRVYYFVGTEEYFFTKVIDTKTLYDYINRNMDIRIVKKISKEQEQT